MHILYMLVSSRVKAEVAVWGSLSHVSFHRVHSEVLAVVELPDFVTSRARVDCCG